MMLVLVTEYLDTLKDIGAQGKSNTLSCRTPRPAVGELFRQMQDAVMIGQTGAEAAKN